MSYLISLNGVYMTEIADEVRILDVIELRPKRTLSAQERLYAPGSVVTRNHVGSRQVRVQFALLTDNPARRTFLLSELSAWAMQGGCLCIGDRPEQQLHVVCTEDPLTMSKRRWTDACEMTFTAFSTPFWEDVTPVTVTRQGIYAETLEIRPWGNVRQVPLRCAVTPVTDTLTQLSLHVNGEVMTFSGLAVPAGKTLAIDYEEGFLTAAWTAEDGTVTPCLKYRTGAESLPLNTRENNAVTIAGDAVFDVTLSARGWYW